MDAGKWSEQVQEKTTKDLRFESKLMDAANAPIEWNKGNHEEVIRYCIDDCQKTYKVFIGAMDSGYFTAIGKDEYVDVPYAPPIRLE